MSMRTTTNTRKFRKKPVVIEAIQYDGSDEIAREIIEWVKQNRGEITYHPGYANIETRFIIQTLEGRMSITPGDYVICGIEGEFYPCKPVIFEASYEEVA